MKKFKVTLNFFIRKKTMITPWFCLYGALSANVYKYKYSVS